MVLRTGIRQTRQDVIDYATRTIDMIIQVGRRGGRRGLLQIDMPSIDGVRESGVDRLPNLTHFGVEH